MTTIFNVRNLLCVPERPLYNPQPTTSPNRNRYWNILQHKLKSMSVIVKKKNPHVVNVKLTHSADNRTCSQQTCWSVVVSEAQVSLITLTMALLWCDWVSTHNTRTPRLKQLHELINDTCVCLTVTRQHVSERERAAHCHFKHIIFVFMCETYRRFSSCYCFLLKSSVCASHQLFCPSPQTSPTLPEASAEYQ